MAANMNAMVSKLESIIGYHCIRDPTLLWEALQASGSLNRVAGDREITDGNKKLAALGDAVADHWLWLNLFRTKCSKCESPTFHAGVSKIKLAEQTCTGKGDTKRQQLLSNKNLTNIGRKLGIEILLVLSPGARWASDYMVATMMEAIIGAVYLDGDMKAVEQLMANLGLEAALLDAA
jgi:dsRNA-specific ribonuclease